MAMNDILNKALKAAAIKLSEDSKDSDICPERIYIKRKEFDEDYLKGEEDMTYISEEPKDLGGLASTINTRGRFRELKDLANGLGTDEARVIAKEMAHRFPDILFEALENEYANQRELLGSIQDTLGGGKF